MNWAVLGGLLPRSPFRIGDVPAIKLQREDARTRRLHPGEDERLLLAAGGLRDLVIAAVETGCRKGELLSLQWWQVRFSPRAELFLPAVKNEDEARSAAPVSSALRTVLNARRHDPAGDPIPVEGFVFGDEIGRPRRSIKTAWRLTCQRAKVDDLHFHDLRREAGSRWMDAGVPLATIQRWLGHANISQTSTYLGASLGGDEQDMQRFEERIGRVNESQITTHTRVPPLTHIDVFDGANGPQGTRTDSATFEKTPTNAIVALTSRGQSSPWAQGVAGRNPVAPTKSLASARSSVWATASGIARLCRDLARIQSPRPKNRRKKSKNSWPGPYRVRPFCFRGRGRRWLDAAGCCCG